MFSFLFAFTLFFSEPIQAQENVLFQFVTLKTSAGDIRLKLYKKEAPLTIENFIGLATGKKQFRDVRTGRKMKETPFYKDMIFHKVHPQLGIQTGCPWGNGKGWPGYTMKAEKNEILFDRPYLVTMALIDGNQNSVGSQFFITTKKAEHLNGVYTVIGEVASGVDIVNKIAQSERDALMRPVNPIQLNEVIIE